MHIHSAKFSILGFEKHIGLLLFLMFLIYTMNHHTEHFFQLDITWEHYNIKISKT